MKWDWGRTYGAGPGEYRRIGMAVAFGWLVAGVASLLLGLIGRTNVVMWVLLGSAMILLGLVADGMAAGVIPRRGRK